MTERLNFKSAGATRRNRPDRTLDRKIADRLQPLIARAESGEDWAEIARLEAEMIASERGA